MVLMGGGLLPSTAAQGLAATAVLAVSAAAFSASCLNVWQAEIDLLAAALSMQEMLVCVAKQRAADLSHTRILSLGVAATERGQHRWRLHYHSAHAWWGLTPVPLALMLALT